MKKLFFSIAFLSAAMLLKAQTADEIVSKHVEALGGKANIDKIQNVIMDGSIDAQGNKVNLTLTKVQGKLVRQDISVMDMKGYDMTTDKEGWTFMPFMGQTAPVEKTGEMLKASQQELNIADNLYNYQGKGTKVELQGKEDVSGVDCFKLKVTDATGDSIALYVNPTTWLITRLTTVKSLNGQSFPVTVDYSDYKEVEGVKFPHTWSTMQGTITFSSIKANQTIDQKLYKHE